MRYFIKTILIVALILFCMFDYMVFSMGDNELAGSIAIFDGLKKITYYQNPFDKNDYFVFAELTDGEVLFSHATAKEISVVGLIAKFPIIQAACPIEEKKPIPLWIYLIALLVIILFPKFKKEVAEAPPYRHADEIRQMPPSIKPTTPPTTTTELNLESKIEELTKEIKELKNQINNK